LTLGKAPYSLRYLLRINLRWLPPSPLGKKAAHPAAFPRDFVSIEHSFPGICRYAYRGQWRDRRTDSVSICSEFRPILSTFPVYAPGTARKNGRDDVAEIMQTTRGNHWQGIFRGAPLSPSASPTFPISNDSSSSSNGPELLIMRVPATGTLVIDHPAPTYVSGHPPRRITLSHARNTAPRISPRFSSRSFCPAFKKLTFFSPPGADSAL